jgi:hypothetical protein
MSPPPKEKRGVGTALKTAELQAEYRLLPVLQPASLAKINGAGAVAWQREAARLFREFWRTGNQKHLRAFFTHVVAMRVYEARATQ